jgi:hypothetical protein
MRDPGIEPGSHRFCLRFPSEALKEIAHLDRKGDSKEPLRFF